MSSLFSSLWTTELGLAGLVVTSLISLVFYIIISSNRREDKRTKCFTESVNDLHSLHRNERSEWREDANYRQKQTNEAIKELSKAINDMIGEHQNNQAKLNLR